MAKAHGAQVVATSRTAAKADAARALGADISLDASAQDLSARLVDTGGADVILDMVGAAYAEANQAALRPGGRWVVIATQSGTLAQVDLLLLMMKQAVLTGSTLRRRSSDEKARLTSAIESRVWPWIASGAVRPPVDATFPLDQAALAHLRLEAGEHVGKIVLTL
jgi:NADPH:quinone reductase-like Zn-dependent oxidoreductase